MRPHPPDPRAPTDDLPPWLAAVPTLGWVDAPAPVEALPDLADTLGLSWLGAKRDDQLPALFGGTKVRKLDHLLACPPWSTAPTWTSAGAVGSGHLLTLTAAAERLGRRLEAHTFWEPVDARALRTLACVAGGPTTLHVHASRLWLGVCAPRVVLGWGPGHIPPGGTLPASMTGLVRAAFELRAQVARGELPPPDHVVVALGTGGTAVGLAMGFALAGLGCTVHAVAAVERALASRWRLSRLEDALWTHLAALGCSAPRPALRLVVHHGFVGPGYGHWTGAGASVEARFPFPLEGAYTAKAASALVAQAPGWAGARVLFWHTAHRDRDVPLRDDALARLPPGLARRVQGGPAWSRRGLLALGALGGVGLAVGARFGGYSRAPGVTLAGWEMEVLAAAAEALLDDPAEPGLVAGITPGEVATRVDRYLQGVSGWMRMELRGLFLLVEHATLPGGAVRRLSRLPVAERRAALHALAGSGGLPAVAVRGLRDLCLIGLYSDDRSWEALGYPGPWVHPPSGHADPAGRPHPPGRYDALLAPPGAPPLWGPR